MLERVDQRTKKRFQVMMSEEYIDKLRHYASDMDMTQGKFIEVLIDRYQQTALSSGLRRSE